MARIDYVRAQLVSLKLTKCSIPIEASHVEDNICLCSLNSIESIGQREEKQKLAKIECKAFIAKKKKNNHANPIVFQSDCKQSTILLRNKTKNMFTFVAQ